MRRLVAAIVTLSAAASVAAAQDSGPRAFEPRRPPPGFEPLGVRLGSFVATPSLGVGEEFNTNILESESDEIDSFITRVTPEIGLRSNFSRHALAASAGAEKAWFHQSSRDDYLDYFGRVRGQLDVTRDARVTAALGYLHGSEGRGSDDSVFGAAEPTEFDRLSLRLDGEYDGGVVRLRPFVTSVTSDFQDTRLLDGTEADESGRDRTRYEGGLEIGYEFLRGYEAFFRGALNATDYDNALPSGGENRDSDGVRLLAGVNLSLTRLIEGYVGVGYEWRDFDAQGFDDYDGLSAEANVGWSVTPLTTLRVGVQRTLEETTVAGASHREVSATFFAVEHELLRNLVLEGALGFEVDAFEGIDRDDDLFTVGMGFEWLLNRSVVLEGQYRYSTEASDAPDEDFDAHQVLINLRYAL